MCRKQSGIAIGRLCDKCDGKCPVCDSYVRPTTLVRICDECSFGNYQNKCVVCGGEGISDAFYCFECTRLEKDRDGCPKIINLGSSRTDVRFSFLLCPHFFHLAYTDNRENSFFTKRKRIGRSSIGAALVWASDPLRVGYVYCVACCITTTPSFHPVHIKGREPKVGKKCAYHLAGAFGVSEFGKDGAGTQKI